jgi:hypothetical protein
MSGWMKVTVFLSALILAAPALRADDPPNKLLDDTENRIKVANQALRLSVQDALNKAGKLPADAALIVLMEAENQLRESLYLPAEEKKALQDQISAKKRLVGGIKPGEAAPAQTRGEDRDQVEHEIRQELNSIRTLQQQGQYGAANARLKALAEKYPTHPALIASSTLGSRSEFAKDRQRQARDRAANQQSALNDIDKSTGNVTPDVKYDPKVWEAAKKRESVGSALTNLTAREKQILQELGKNTAADFVLNNTSFDQVLKMLEKELGFPLVISKATMDDMRITYETVLTYTMPKNVEKRTLLRGVLGELGLTYVIKGETLQVMSVLQAKNEMRAGVIDIRSMMTRGSTPEDLIRFIKATIDPESWDTSGGAGTITFHPPGTLIIRNSAEVIYSLGARRK